MESQENDLQVVVERLEAEVVSKEGKLQSLQSELGEIKSHIHRLQQDRHGCIEKLFQTQEASPLVSENKQMGRQLREKMEHIERFKQGEAKEQTEVKELERQLEELQSGEVRKQLEKEDKENTAAIKELNEMFEKKVETLQSAQEELEKMRSEVVRLKAQQSKGNFVTVKKRLTLDEKLDKLVLKTSQKAGLELHTHTSH